MELQIKGFLLGVTLFVILAMGTAPVAAYEYECSTDTYEYERETDDEYTSTHEEEATAIATADEYDEECACIVSTWTWAEEDSASAEAEADASFEKAWDWNGPPGEAPGGTLSWSHAGGGYTSAEGKTTPSSGTAESIADADSETWAYSPGTFSYTWSNSFGHVEDMDNAEGGSDADGSPPPYDEDNADDSGSGWYNFSISWDTWDSDSDEIASGTTRIVFFGGATCDAWSGAAGGPSASGAIASAETDAYAMVSLSATFTSN